MSFDAVLHKGQDADKLTSTLFLYVSLEIKIAYDDKLLYLKNRTKYV